MTSCLRGILRVAVSISNRRLLERKNVWKVLRNQSRSSSRTRVKALLPSSWEIALPESLTIASCLVFFSCCHLTSGIWGCGSKKISNISWAPYQLFCKRSGLNFFYYYCFWMYLQWISQANYNVKIASTFLSLLLKGCLSPLEKSNAWILAGNIHLNMNNKIVSII